MEIFKIFVTIMGVGMSFGYYPQAYMVWKNKSAKNVSIPAYIIFSLGTLTWFVYGLFIKDPIIITSFMFGVVGSWMVLLFSLYYKHK